MRNAAISAPNMDVLSKLMMRRFEAQTQKIFQEGERKLIFPNLGPRRQRSQCEANITLPSMCVLMQTVPVFTSQCPVDAVINGVRQNCTVGCETQDTRHKKLVCWISHPNYSSKHQWADTSCCSSFIM